MFYHYIIIFTLTAKIPIANISEEGKIILSEEKILLKVNYFPIGCTFSVIDK